MAKLKLTKGELKKGRDSLAGYERYLPILQLKKQQLQMEIINQLALLVEKKEKEEEKRRPAEAWAGLLTDKSVDIRPWIVPKNIFTASRNIAGIGITVFERAEFETDEYDLFSAPLWVDGAIEALKALASLRKEIEIIADGVKVLRNELRVTTQRVNLFEKVKIPETQEAIRVIRIYIGDQMANAVGRSKIAKRKIGAALAEEVSV